VQKLLDQSFDSRIKALATNEFAFEIVCQEQKEGSTQSKNLDEARIVRPALLKER
jgi:hypothetical protein